MSHEKQPTNPWLCIPASEYDAHLDHPAVRQREFLDRVFSRVVAENQPRSIVLLGCATGGGLDSIEVEPVERLTVVDLNPEYLELTRLRYQKRWPNLEGVRMNLETEELDANAYDLVHCALVLEYVEPKLVLNKMARWLAPSGTLVVVLQLPSSEHQAVTETGCESLKLLEPVMRLHDPDAIRHLAKSASLVETSAKLETLETGKSFYVGQFRKK